MINEQENTEYQFKSVVDSTSMKNKNVSRSRLEVEYKNGLGDKSIMNQPRPSYEIIGSVLFMIDGAVGVRSGRSVVV